MTGAARRCPEKKNRLGEAAFLMANPKRRAACIHGIPCGPLCQHRAAYSFCEEGMET